MIILSAADVERLLDLDRLVDALADAMTDLSAGRASMPPRVAARVDEADGMLSVMPAHLPTARVLEAKLVSVFPENDRHGIPSHQALIAVFDPATGTPTALMDGTYITAARTAAGSALATRLLARPDSSVLAILGTGVQARAHARAVPRVMRRLGRVVVAGRSPENAAALARDLAEGGLPAEPAESVEEAQRVADVVCATTHAADPVVRRAWLAPGVHVNSVGFNVQGCEVDADTVADAVVVVESRTSTLAEPPAGANDLTRVIRDGRLSPDDVVEIGELVTGSRPGRTSDRDITLYRSVGVAVQDAAAAALVLEAARDRGAGTEIDL